MGSAGVNVGSKPSSASSITNGASLNRHRPATLDPSQRGAHLGRLSCRRWSWRPVEGSVKFVRRRLAVLDPERLISLTIYASWTKCDPFWSACAVS
jgi:hypothetical protein